MVGRSIIVFITLALAGSAAFATERIRLLGTLIDLAPPPGMVPSEEFAGFADPTNGSAMLVVELPVSRSEVPDFLSAMTDDVLAAQGLSRVDRGALPDGVPGNVLITAEQSAHGISFEHWIYIAPGERALAMITVQVPQQFASELVEAQLRSSLASVRVAPNVPTGGSDPAAVESLPFTFADSERFAVRSVMAGNTVLLLAAGGAEKTEAILLISKSFATGGQDHLETSTDALETLEGVEEISIDDAFAEVAVGDLTGIELTARCIEKGSGEPCFAYQMMLFDTDAYYRVFGLTHADLAEAYLPVFKRIARSLAPK